jgi:hypothetical protein
MGFGMRNVALPWLIAGLALPVAAPGFGQELPPLTGKDVAIHMDPSAEREPRFYPEVAQKHHVEGAASVLCTINDKGVLSACATAAENPPGYGFAEATARLASHMRVAPRAKDGSPTAGRKLRIDMVYKLPG